MFIPVVNFAVTLYPTLVLPSSTRRIGTQVIRTMHGHCTLAQKINLPLEVFHPLHPQDNARLTSTALSMVCATLQLGFVPVMHLGKMVPAAKNRATFSMYFHTPTIMFRHTAGLE